MIAGVFAKPVPRAERKVAKELAVDLRRLGTHLFAGESAAGLADDDIVDQAVALGQWDAGQPGRLIVRLVVRQDVPRVVLFEAVPKLFPLIVETIRVKVAA